MKLYVTWEETDLEVEFPPGATVEQLRPVLPGRPEEVWNGSRRCGDEASISTIPSGSILTSAAGRPRPIPERGRLEFHRPPRVAATPEPPPPVAPVSSDDPVREVRFRWVMAAVPLIGGVFLALVFGPMMAAFSLIGVLMAVGGWAEDRIALGRERRRASDERAKALARFRREWLAWQRGIADLRCSSMPGPVEVLSRAATISPSLWQRRPTHSDFGIVSVGVASDGIPKGVMLAPQLTIGIAGATAAGLARWIVLQAVTHHGPADLSVSGSSADEWDWLKWLPHTSVVAPLELGIDRIGSERVCGIVIASHSSLLPGVCDIVIEAGVDGSATVVRTADGHVWSGTSITVKADEALTAARGMSYVRDPEAAGTLSSEVSLRELLESPTAASIAEAWGRSDSKLVARLGAGIEGPLDIDLIGDGPHGLLAGTTGSGKSELLRSFVTSLALRYPPGRVVFVLIDYKGGATFDPLRRLPHVAGSITDLDPAGAGRLLEAVAAEVRTREEVLRAAERVSLGADDSTLPHLVVIVDEFATLAEQAPAVLDGLVDLARRGRSLGLHLLLATQRPAGVVSEKIRANTSIRIALRVHDRSDSEDVIGSASAARLDRRHPGRGFVRLGPGELKGFQCAYVSGTSDVVRVAPFDTADRPPAADTGVDLDQLIDAIRMTAVDLGESEAIPVWRPPLPASVHVRDLPAGDRVPIGLVDNARHDDVLEWEATNVLAVDPTGVDSGAALGGFVTAVCAARPATHVHIVGVHRRSPLARLAQLGNVGNVVEMGEGERTDRLLRYLSDEIRRRRLEHRLVPMIMLVFEDLAGGEPIERIIEEGPSVGVFTAASIRHAGAIGGRLLAGFQERLAFHLIDPYEYLALGIGFVPDIPEGAAFSLSRQRVVRIVDAECLPGVGSSLAVPEIRPLPSQVPLASIEGRSSDEAGTLIVPFGLGGASVLRVVAFHLDPGRHAVVTGPPGSGKSTALRAVAASASGRTPVQVLHHPIEITDCSPGLCLIDDAQTVDLDLAAVPTGVHLVVASRTGDLPHGHWIRRLAADADGLSLRPDHRDEELWRVRLARTALPGRGTLISRQETVPVQVASGTMGPASKEDT